MRLTLLVLLLIVSGISSSSAQQPGIILNSVGIKLKLISAGTFAMGEGNSSHQVTLTKAYYLGLHEVTQSQYEQVMESNPSTYRGANNPVEMVSWEDAVAFCERLSALPEEQRLGRIYRLPTEAEWEYACRAGTTTDYSFGDIKSSLGDYAWYKSNASRTTHPVGEKQPNGWGLCDMHGNVFEWCADWHGAYPSVDVTDPTGSVSGSYRVARGGSWYRQAEVCLSALRSSLLPSHRDREVGFRIALSPGSE